jgi:hypothetical protein
VAALQLEGDELVLHLSHAEKAEAVRGDLRVPLSTIRGVEVLDDAHSWTAIGVGFKVGMRVPGTATVATVRGHAAGADPRRLRFTGSALVVAGARVVHAVAAGGPWVWRVRPSGLVAVVVPSGWQVMCQPQR